MSIPVYIALWAACFISSVNSVYNCVSPANYEDGQLSSQCDLKGNTPRYCDSLEDCVFANAERLKMCPVCPRRNYRFGCQKRIGGAECCMNSHTECQNQPTPLPTRIIPNCVAPNYYDGDLNKNKCPRQRQYPFYCPSKDECLATDPSEACPFCPRRKPYFCQFGRGIQDKCCAKSDPDFNVRRCITPVQPTPSPSRHPKPTKPTPRPPRDCGTNENSGPGRRIQCQSDADCCKRPQEFRCKEDKQKCVQDKPQYKCGKCVSAVRRGQCPSKFPEWCGIRGLECCDYNCHKKPWGIECGHRSNGISDYGNMDNNEIDIKSAGPQFLL